MGKFETHRTKGTDGYMSVWSPNSTAIKDVNGHEATNIVTVMLDEIMRGVKRADHLHIPFLMQKSDVVYSERKAQTVLSFARLIVAAAKLPVESSNVNEEERTKIIGALEECLRRAEKKFEAKSYLKSIDDLIEVYFFWGRIASDWPRTSDEAMFDEHIEDIGYQGIGFEIVRHVLSV